MNKIKQFRKKHKLTQRKLGELLGKNWRTIQRWESGEWEVTPLEYRVIDLVESGKLKIEDLTVEKKLNLN